MSKLDHWHETAKSAAADEFLETEWSALEMALE